MKQNHKPLFIVLVRSSCLALSLFLAACGGSGKSPTPDSSTGKSINGQALAPGGLVAKFQQQSLMLAALDVVLPAASAAITGLEAVGGATVELIRINDSGEQVGEVLASTVTSITGNYSLSLPSGVDFSGDLVVRITGNSGKSMSAMVVEEKIDITPITEFILNKFIDSDTRLSALAVNEVVALEGKVEEFDLTATADLSSMLEQLEAETGFFVDNQVASISVAAGSAASVAGNWTLLTYGLGMHDSDPSTTNTQFGTLAMDGGQASLSFTDGGADVVNISLSAEEEFYTNYMTDKSSSVPITSIDYESAIGTGGDTFTANIDAQGSILVESEFEEDLESTDLATGPEFGWREAPGTELFVDTGASNLKVAMTRFNAVRYETTDTNGDGVKDAVDPNARDGDEMGLGFNVLVKQGSGMSNASMSGNYGVVSTYLIVSTDNDEVVAGSSTGILNFDGSGSLTAATNAFVESDVKRNFDVFPQVDLERETESDPDAIDGDYSVTSTGELSLDFDVDDSISAILSSDGNFFASVTPYTEGDLVITESEQELIMGVKLGDTAPALANNSYKLFLLLTGFDAGGGTEIFTLSANSLLSIDAAGTAATLNGDGFGLYRGSDVAEVEAFNDSGDDPLNLVVSSQASGEVSFNMETDEEILELEGYASADGSMLVLSVSGQDAEENDEYYDVGVILAIKQ
jgi:hypothetical protein